MIYKALISDFDNTLIDRSDRFSPEILDAIRLLVDSGVIVTLATGRPYVGLLQSLMNQFPDHFKYPLIIHGGAEIVEPQTGSVLWGEYIHKKQFLQLFDYLFERKLFFLAEHHDAIYCSEGNRDLRGFGDGMVAKDAHEIDVDHIAKIVIPAGMAKLTLDQVLTVEEELKKRYSDLHIIKITYGGGYGLDITSGRASKQIGVLEFLKHQQLSPDDVVGMGDGYNDYPLLMAVGAKVAMGDAPEELKAIADFIAPTQAEMGLLAVVKKYFPHLR